MSFPAFSNPWYADIIERFTPERRVDYDEVDGLILLGRMVIVSACILAQAIDGAAEALTERKK